MKLLSFYDPLEMPYGGFSNIAPISCTIRGKRYATVQVGVYSVLLNSDVTGSDPYEIYHTYQYQTAFRFRAEMTKAIETAYRALHQKYGDTPLTRIPTTYRLIQYKPSSIQDPGKKTYMPSPKKKKNK